MASKFREEARQIGAKIRARSVGMIAMDFMILSTLETHSGKNTGSEANDIIVLPAHLMLIF